MNNLSTQFVPKPALEYPFGIHWSPSPGEPFEVADGVYWLRVPLPIALDHINLWLLRDGDGWTIVDSGYDHPMCKNVWQQVFDTFLNPTTVKRVIVTHFHPDHIGLASWLARRCGCPILISQGEFGLYQKIVTGNAGFYEKDLQSFVRELGLPQQQRALVSEFFSKEKNSRAVPLQIAESMCHFIADGDEFEAGGRVWRVVSGNGHSPEHACLFCADLEVLISGDQSIPRISSNVGVFPADRQADPLADWLASCAKLRDYIPKNTLILPSHQEPFIGNAERMQQLIDDHHIQLNRLRLALRQPTTVAAAVAVLFQRELRDAGMVLATGETLAHLNYLLHRNEIQKVTNADGVAEYCLKID